MMMDLNQNFVTLIKHLTRAYDPADHELSFEEVLSGILKDPSHPEVETLQKMLAAGLQELQEDAHSWEAFLQSFKSAIFYRFASGIHRLTTDEEQAYRDLIESEPKLVRAFELIQAEWESIRTKSELSLQLYKQGTLIPPSMGTESQIIYRGLTPGSFELQVETGLSLWKKELRSHDLILSAGLPLDMAATTDGEDSGEPLGGSNWALRIVAGPESGSLILKKLKS